MISVIQRILDALARILLALAGTALVCMMFVTIIDVIVRNFGSVIPFLKEVRFIGAIELVRYLFLLATAGSMPWWVEKSQVIVELFTQKLPPQVRARIDALWLFGFAVLGALLCYSLSVSAGHAIATGETSADLYIPLWFIRAGAAFCMGLMAVRAFFVALVGLRKGELNVA